MAVTSVFIVSTCAVAIFFPDIISMLSIIGGLCSTTMCFVIPMIAKIQLGKDRWYHTSNLTAIFVFAPLTIIGYTGTAIAIYNIVEQQPFIGDRPDLPQ